MALPTPKYSRRCAGLLQPARAAQAAGSDVSETARATSPRLAHEEHRRVRLGATAKDYATNDSALIRERIVDQASKDGVILLHDIYKGTVPAVPGDHRRAPEGRLHLRDRPRADGPRRAAAGHDLPPLSHGRGTIHRP
ncbi:hypothetical protein SCALM49S_01589 [Streptomyces californicus]